jgi:phosphoribosyl 1,2-cyclic phosphate phosphodiesterase
VKLTFLGTAAATSYPLAFCKCDICNQARLNGGKDLRKRSSLLINDDLLIDLGPDIVSASFAFHFSVAEIRFWLQTHAHSDHFDASLLSTRHPDFNLANANRLSLYASEPSLTRMSSMMEAVGFADNLFDIAQQTNLNMSVYSVAHGQSFEAGNYRVTAFSANHDKSVGPLMFAVELAGVAILYATDTDSFPEETWRAIIKKKTSYDVVVLDHTYGMNIEGGGHLNANRFIEQINRMKSEGVLSNGARVFATHISHEGNPTHSVLEKQASQHGYEIAYDGLVVEL